MLKRTLGGLEVNALGMGCWAVGGPLTEAQVKEIQAIVGMYELKG